MEYFHADQSEKYLLSFFVIWCPACSCITATTAILLCKKWWAYFMLLSKVLGEITLMR